QPAAPHGYRWWRRLECCGKIGRDDHSIAEMRTYGEGFIIVDQSPTAVDISAIKNTNTKIVMRLPEKADFEAVGNSFALDDEQIREISRLRRGAAIVSQSGWLEPVMVSVHRAGNKYEVAERVDAPRECDSTVSRYIHKVLEQVENAHFNEHSIELLLRKSTLTINRKNELLHLYRGIVDVCETKDVLTKEEKAAFMIRAIGCTGLADIYPLRLNEQASLAENKTEYAKWRRRIADALDLYGDFGEMNEKLDIASALSLYMAATLKRTSYIRARGLLSKKE
ncbi:MAG: ATP-binding protein, partial [Clostridia bacterium]|nr:ATP-binding protein [Clostridia bacterium]